MSASDPAAVVRSATGQDVPALAAVAAATFELACPPSMTRERVEAFVSEVLSAARFTEYTADPARHLLLAERRGETLGYAMLVAGEPSDDDVRAAIRHRPTVELSQIYVLPPSAQRVRVTVRSGPARPPSGQRSLSCPGLTARVPRPCS